MTEVENEIGRSTLETIIGRYGWRGQWNEVELIGEIVENMEQRRAHVRGKTLTQIAENAATFCYCQRWYAACRKDGALEQHEAFDALWKYIYRSTLYKVRGDEDIAQEVAQQVLLSIWRSLDKVREPGAFVAYVRQAIVWQIPKTMRSQAKVEGEELVEDFPDSGAEEMLEGAEEDMADVEELIRRCLPSKDRQAVILEYFLRGKSISDIAQSLGKKVGTISVLKLRAIEQLRSCTELSDWRSQSGGGTATESNAPVKSVAYLFAVLDSADSGMTCDECRSWLPAYVEAEVSGYDVAQRYPKVRAHLDFCADCEREYVELLDSTLEEMESEWANVPIPPPDLSFLPPLSFQSYLRQLLEGVIQRRRPARLPDIHDQMDSLLRQFTAQLSGPVPTAVGTMGPDRTYERLNLATFDVARSLLQEAPQNSGRDEVVLEQWVRQRAELAARHQKLSGPEADAFVDAVTELVCRNPFLLPQTAQ